MAMQVINMYNEIYDSDGITVERTEEFDYWLRRLRDDEVRYRIKVRVARIRRKGNLGDFKSVGDGVYERSIVSMSESRNLREAKEWDLAEYLESKEEVIGFINACLEEDDCETLWASLGDIARSRGMTQLSRETGITRDGLYKAFAPGGDPSFSNVMKVLRALGLRLSVSVA